MDVKTLCLGVLTERPMSGYEIKKRFEESFRHFFAAGYGSIYPALADLNKNGFVIATSVEQEKRPDKKIYQITQAGLNALTSELLETPPRHKVRSEFLALMYFAHLLPPEKTRDSIEQMVKTWRSILDEDLVAFEKSHSTEDCPLEPGMAFALGFGRTVLSAAVAYVQRQQPGLERRLIEQRSSKLPTSDNPFTTPDSDDAIHTANNDNPPGMPVAVAGE